MAAFSFRLCTLPHFVRAYTELGVGAEHSHQMGVLVQRLEMMEMQHRHMADMMKVRNCSTQNRILHSNLLIMYVGAKAFEQIQQECQVSHDIALQPGPCVRRSHKVYKLVYTL